MVVSIAGCSSGSSGDDGGGKPSEPSETLLDSPYFDQRFKQGESTYIGQYLVLDSEAEPVKGEAGS